MRFILLSSLLTIGAIATSCAPRTSAVAGVTVTPVLIKVSSSAARGGTATIQGRYLGGPSSAKILLGADEDGKGGYALPANAIQSWTDSQIVFTVPSDAPVGGSWLFVQVGDMRSTGLPFSVQQ
ncbi:IPT/TIG domain-containing protein [Deinococcus sonorensis]|uniref:IPT/TIG domain-containing protein n=2 Tax=Deinococcus sonorensis TaxID=309891 RepID=A0AAU7UA86_9DEIO